MNLLNTLELNRLIGYMDALRWSLNGCNYVTWFDAKELKLEDTKIDIQALIKLAYPQTKVENATFSESSSLHMVETINGFIGRVNPYDRDKNLADSKKRNLTTGFWNNLSKCIDYQNAKIIEYIPQGYNINDPLNNFVFSGFTFLIINQEQKLCLVIHGSSSD
ncbi:MAG: hypothetical protein QNJ34_24150 [Xenococcaceae cyanobacterium MO_188.B29]|nr:hypothetical protein [Xenococcaceae cyanobacterium MO_188.B29]